MTDDKKTIPTQSPILVVGKNAINLVALDFNNPQHTKLLENMFTKQIKKKEKAFDRAEKRKQNPYNRIPRKKRK